MMEAEESISKRLGREARLTCDMWTLTFSNRSDRWSPVMSGSAAPETIQSWPCAPEPFFIATRGSVLYQCSGQGMESLSRRVILQTEMCVLAFQSTAEVLSEAMKALEPVDEKKSIGSLPSNSSSISLSPELAEPESGWRC